MWAHRSGPIPVGGKRGLNVAEEQRDETEINEGKERELLVIGT